MQASKNVEALRQNNNQSFAYRSNPDPSVMTDKLTSSMSKRASEVPETAAESLLHKVSIAISCRPTFMFCCRPIGGFFNREERVYQRKLSLKIVSLKASGKRVVCQQRDRGARRTNSSRPPRSTTTAFRVQRSCNHIRIVLSWINFLSLMALDSMKKAKRLVATTPNPRLICYYYSRVGTR